MSDVLISWIGATDLRAADQTDPTEVGPIARALDARSFDRVVLLYNYDKKKVDPFLRWLGRRATPPVDSRHVDLSSPTNFGEIYEVARQAISDTLTRQSADTRLTIHLSPGTPTMSAVWIILAKTRFPAELIQSSPQKGVETASVPFDMSAEFIPDLLRAPDARLEELSRGLPPEAPEFEAIVHRSEVMRRAVARARLVAPRSVPVLLEGESGTGKELFARAIHNSGPRREGPFIPINCGAIPSELIESELFGHVKGAFTGATGKRLGHLREANGGTLFLDEAGELPRPAQVKLLRALQQNEVVPVGASKPEKVDVRILAATNRSLLREAAEGRFRSDLFYRLAVAILVLPPLCRREGDVGLLLDHFLAQVNADNEGQPSFRKKVLSPGARNLLLNHDWPGNVRELHNTLQRAAIWSTGETIDEIDAKEALLPSSDEGTRGILGKPLGNGFSLPETLATVARHYLDRARDEAAGNKTQAAELVGLASYQTFTNWLKKYGLEN